MSSSATVQQTKNRPTRTKHRYIAFVSFITTVTIAAIFFFLYQHHKALRSLKNELNTAEKEAGLHANNILQQACAKGDTKLGV